MFTFLIGLAVLIVGGALYGRREKPLSLGS